jgi:hypothetical protein
MKKKIFKIIICSVLICQIIKCSDNSFKKEAEMKTLICSYLLFETFKNSNPSFGLGFQAGLYCIDKYGYEKSEFYPFVQ